MHMHMLTVVVRQQRVDPPKGLTRTADHPKGYRLTRAESGHTASDTLCDEVITADASICASSVDDRCVRRWRAGRGPESASHAEKRARARFPDRSPG